MRNYPNILTLRDWLSIEPQQFENLALRHVRDVYPGYRWRSTPYSGDKGRDAVGHPKRRDETFLLRRALYWMEAKRHSRPLGSCRLDKHLVSMWSAGGTVTRLHIVASSGFAQPFKAHARAFGSDHGFVVAFSDGVSLAAWLHERPKLVRDYFGTRSAEITTKLAMVARLPSFAGVLAEAFILADDDRFDDIATVQELLVPGEKYRLIIHFSAFSAADRLSRLDLRWPVPTSRAQVLSTSLLRRGLRLVDTKVDPILEFEFRYLGQSLPPLQLVDRETGAQMQIALDVQDSRRFVPELVGERSESTVIELARKVNGSRSGKPAVVAITGRAGAGKSRVASEARDDARRNNVTVKMLTFGTDEDSNEDQWIRFFGWLFGVSNNVFFLSERKLVESALEKMDATADVDTRRWSRVIRLIAHMVKARTLVEELFADGTVEARYFGLMVERALAQRAQGLLVHLEDAHHLSTRLITPLWLLRRVLRPPSRLHVLVTLTARNDETVTQTAIGNFLGDGAGLQEFEVKDFGERDAQTFVRKALRVAPELVSEENYFVSEVIRRAGTNPFALTQTVESILASDEAFERRADLGVVIIQNSRELERALESVPEGVREILRERFKRLVDRPAGRTLFEILLMAAVLGRGASVRLIERALKLRDSRTLLKQLVQLGYVKDVRAARLELAHDIMAESLLRQNARGAAAKKLAEVIDVRRRASATVEQRARIYFHAGRRYYRKSWTLLTQVVRAANTVENYSQILASASMIDTIAKTSRNATDVDRDLEAKIAGAYGHSGRTSVAIVRYRAAAEAWEPTAATNVEAQLEYLRLRIQLANQHSTRGEIEQALTIAQDALDILTTSHLPLPSRSRADVLSFGLNRMGAMHKVVEEFDTAVRLFQESLEISRGISKHYLMSNCLTNLATIHARTDIVRARAAVNEAIAITAAHLGHKGRRQVMVDTCKACVDCFESNDASSRLALRTTFMRAREAGYFGQITGALLPYAYFSLRADKVADAEWASQIVLDYCSKSEDWFARLFGRYYLAVCYVGGGQVRLAQTFARSTLKLTRDARVLASPVCRALRNLGRTGAIERDSLLPFTRV